MVQKAPTVPDDTVRVASPLPAAFFLPFRRHGLRQEELTRTPPVLPGPSPPDPGPQSRFAGLCQAAASVPTWTSKKGSYSVGWVSLPALPAPGARKPASL